MATPPSAARPSAVAADSRFDRELEERFVRYARIDTQSDEASTTSPSTQKQFDLLKLLVTELKAIGAHDVRLTDYGAVLATIRPTAKSTAPAVAFLAHVDTAPGFNATNVRPIVHRNYAGGDLVLPDDPNVVLSPRQYPYLAGKRGDDIVTASGTTLLGADGKAGVAIVMTMARHLLQNPDLRRGPIRIGFTPDEEVGRGVHRNLRDDLKADVAYTLDGAGLGEIVYETFSADKAHVSVKGVCDPSRTGQGQAGQRSAPCRQDRRDAAAGDADAGNHRGSRGLHPRLPDERQCRRGRHPFHPA